MSAKDTARIMESLATVMWGAAERGDLMDNTAADLSELMTHLAGQLRAALDEGRAVA